MVNLSARQVLRGAVEAGESLQRAGLRFNLHSLIGGQMAGDSAHRLFLVYPGGNWVEIGPDTPYQIIGATGFVGSRWALAAARSFDVFRAARKFLGAPQHLTIDITDPTSASDAFDHGQTAFVTPLTDLSDIHHCERIRAVA